MTLCGFSCRFATFALVASGIMGGLYYLLIQAPAHNFGASFGMLLLLFAVSLLYIWVEVTYFHSKTELNGVEYHMPITGKTGDVTTPTSAAPKKEEEVCI